RHADRCDRIRRARPSRGNRGAEARGLGRDAERRRTARKYPAVARSSYVSPAVVERYLDCRTIGHFPPGICAWRQGGIPTSIRGKSDARARSLVADTHGAQSCVEFVRHFGRRRSFVARKTVLVCDNCGKEVDEGKGAVLRVTYTDARRGA